MIRIANGGGPRQADIYLRDWSIKHELRNRAMVYDTGGISITPYVSIFCVYIILFVFWGIGLIMGFCSLWS